jgi:hypothetical protein
MAPRTGDMPPRHHEAEGDGGVEVAARHGAQRRHHHQDGQAVRQRDAHQLGAAGQADDPGALLMARIPTKHSVKVPMASATRARPGFSGICLSP